MKNPAIEKAIKIVGSQGEFARQIGVSQGYASQMLTGYRPVSHHRVIAIALATRNKVRPHDLRPDLYPAEFRARKPTP